MNPIGWPHVSHFGRVSHLSPFNPSRISRSSRYSRPPRGLTLSSAFCRIPMCACWLPSASGISTPHGRAIPSMGFRHRSHQGRTRQSRPLIEGLLTVMSSHATSQTRPFEIIFVDDGSSDGSSDALDNLAVQHSQIRVFHFDRNYGKTCALEAGFSQSSGEIIIQIDGDLQQDSQDILKLLPYTDTHDLVCGWRQERQDGLVKKMSSRIANRVRNFFTHDGVHDTGCPLKIFRRPVLERLRLFEGMHRFFPALAPHARVHGYRGTGPALRAHSRRLKVRHGQSIVQISLRFDCRAMDANQSVAIYIPRQVTNGQERGARDAR